MEPRPYQSEASDKDRRLDWENIPEALIFYPTEAEFADPVHYLHTIRALAEPVGICKIVPPASFRPPLSLKEDRLRFRPRLQRPCELGASGRIRLNYVNGLMAYWRLQGTPILRMPYVDKRPVDLFALKNSVVALGGYETVAKKRLWVEIARRMGYSIRAGMHTASALAQNYEKHVLPYEVFQAQKSKSPALGQAQSQASSLRDGSSAPLRPVALVPGENAKRGAGSAAQEDGADWRKRFRGDCDSEDEEDVPRMCQECGKSDSAESNRMLSCHRCRQRFHMFCLTPPMFTPPARKWSCPVCVRKEYDSNVTSTYGFEDSKDVVSIRAFGAKASKFKADYFHLDEPPVASPGVSLPPTVPLRTLEREFWKLVDESFEEIEVEYGADIPTSDVGSGFPTVAPFNVNPDSSDYVCHPWNLNNLPRLNGTLLPLLKADIPGMIVPWMYVGMCFSSFCWHNEDHHTYSANYLHWGEPKTWYGVPGSQSEKFEKFMKTYAAELFQDQPDLLQQLVTLVSPIALMKEKIHVYRVDQYPGEFIITFPRAYHAGFNHGFNCAEAVNFAPYEWLRHGRECMLHYSELKRAPVFSHEELVCNAYHKLYTLPEHMTVALFQELSFICDDYERLFRPVQLLKINNFEKVNFETIPDDRRSCAYCKTVCFIAAYKCKCVNGIVCLRHLPKECSCRMENRLIQYRFSQMELCELRNQLQTRIRALQSWSRDTQRLFGISEGHSKISEHNLLDMISAGQKLYSDPILCYRLRGLKEIYTKYQTLRDTAARLLSKKHPPAPPAGPSSSISDQNPKATRRYEDFIRWIDEAKHLPIELPNYETIVAISKKIALFQETVCAISTSSTNLTSYELEQLMSTAQSIRSYIDPKDMDKVVSLRRVRDWASVAQDILSNRKQMMYPHFVAFVDEGEKLNAPRDVVEKLVILRSSLMDLKRRIATALELYPSVEDIDQLMIEANKNPISQTMLSTLPQARDAVLEWEVRFNDLYFVQKPTYENAKRLLAITSPNLASNPKYAFLQSAVSSCNALLRKLSFIFAIEGDARKFVELVGPKVAPEVVIFRNVVEARKAVIKRSHTDIHCICDGPQRGLMYRCNLCLCWYHQTCLTEANFRVETRVPFFCRKCKVTNRPHIGLLVDLLKEANSIPIYMKEFDVISNLHSQAVKCLKRIRILLANDSAPQESMYESLLESDYVECVFDEQLILRRRLGLPNIVTYNFDLPNSNQSIKPGIPTRKDETQAELEETAAQDSQE